MACSSLILSLAGGFAERSVTPTHCLLSLDHIPCHLHVDQKYLMVFGERRVPKASNMSVCALMSRL